MLRRLYWSLLIATVALAPLSLVGAQGQPKGIQYAFLVGCGDYAKGQFKSLPYTFNDVAQFQQALLETGFAAKNIVLLHDKQQSTRFRPLKANMLREIDLLLDGMESADTLVVALSGHGVQFKGDPVSYFVPVDGKWNDKKTLIPLSGKDGLYERLKTCKAKKKLLIVNACRNDPTTDPTASKNQAELVDEDRREEVPEGIAAIYSCKEQQKSYYDYDRKLAIFYDHVIRAWKGEYTKGGPVTLEEFFNQVKSNTKMDVNAIYGEPQVPVVMREYTGEWVIGAAKAVAEGPKESNRPAEAPKESPKAVAKKTASEDLLITEMKFVHAPKGTFWMGWTSDKKESKQVTIANDFQIAAYTVTQGQWEAIMGTNPSYFSRRGGGKDKVKDISDVDLKRFPVENVSWNDVQEFLKKLNERERGKGRTYRLPTEAEWEYACRGAATNKEECSYDFYLQTPSNDLSSMQANFYGESPGGSAAKGPNMGRTTKVGSYAPNKLGLYDMHGNVWQWCQDLYEPGASARVLRGGSWISIGGFCRAGYRGRYVPDNRDFSLGFRLAAVPVGAQ